MSEQLRKQVLDKLNYESLSPFDLDTSLTEGIDGSTAIVKDSFSEDQIKVNFNNFQRMDLNF